MRGTGEIKPVVESVVDPKLAILDDGWGHQRSLYERDAIDGNGDPLPWYTYPAIEYLRQLDFSDGGCAGSRQRRGQTNDW